MRFWTPLVTAERQKRLADGVQFRRPAFGIVKTIAI